MNKKLKGCNRREFALQQLVVFWLVNSLWVAEEEGKDDRAVKGGATAELTSEINLSFGRDLVGFLRHHSSVL
jgi:hypothetical protein